MNEIVGFSVIYRFKLHPGKEAAFKEGWTRLTKAIRDKRGGLGSRLHLSDDGTWVAYAQWPDRRAWERAQKQESADAEAAQLMADSVEERLPPILLEPIIDLLEIRRTSAAD